MNTMIPVPALRPWVAEVALMRPGSALPLVHLPDAATALVYCGAGARDGGLRVGGPRSRAVYYPGKELPMCIRVRLCPGAARPVFGVPVSELRDQAVPLAGLWGDRAARLENRLNELAGPGPVLRGIEDALLESLHHSADSRPAAPRGRRVAVHHRRAGRRPRPAAVGQRTPAARLVH